MAIEDRLYALGDRHRALDHEIRTQVSRPASDDLELAEMKKRKLALKDQIESIRRTH